MGEKDKGVVVPEKKWRSIFVRQSGRWEKKLMTDREYDIANHQSGDPAYDTREIMEKNKGTVGDGDKRAENIRRWLNSSDSD